MHIYSYIQHTYHTCFKSDTLEKFPSRPTGKVLFEAHANLDPDSIEDRIFPGWRNFESLEGQGDIVRNGEEHGGYYRIIFSV